MVNNLVEVIYVILLTLVPGIELRGSIPLALLVYKHPFSIVFLITVINILITPLVFLFWDAFLFVAKRIKILDRFVNFYLRNLQKRSEKVVDKYGFFGLMLFVAIPLPGTGAYSGALIAEIFGMKKLQAFVAVSLGVLIAAAVVTLAIFGIIPLRLS